MYNNKIYGITVSGGSDLRGILFEWDPEKASVTQTRSFFNQQGNRPSGSPIMYNNKYYGMTMQDGAQHYDSGVLYEWDPATNIYNVKQSFNAAKGEYPQGSLSLYNAKFYGMTQRGGLDNMGVIFEYDPSANIYLKKIDLNNTIGSKPFGNLTFYENKFYGLTYEGGINAVGVIFEWDPLSNVFTKIRFQYYRRKQSTRQPGIIQW